jgi:hypothetical protein
VGNVTAAAELAGLTRTNHYLWGAASPTYAEAFRAAQEEAVERLEEEARRRAMAGSDLLLIFLLKALRPEKYRERHEHRHGGTTDAPPIRVDPEHQAAMQRQVDCLPIELRRQLLEALTEQENGNTPATTTERATTRCGLVELPPAEPVTIAAPPEPAVVTPAEPTPPPMPQPSKPPATSPANGTTPANRTPPAPQPTGNGRRPPPDPTFGIDPRLWHKL